MPCKELDMEMARKLARLGKAGRGGALRGFTAWRRPAKDGLALDGRDGAAAFLLVVPCAGCHSMGALGLGHECGLQGWHYRWPAMKGVYLPRRRIGDTPILIGQK